MISTPSTSLSQDSRQTAALDPSLVIGLVNNMPDAALQTTELQFSELLCAASHNSVRLKCFSLPELPRSDVGRALVSEHYEDIGALWTSHLDGLIVTGTEPRAPALVDEPYWPSLTKLVDWVDDHAIPTIWSCLAAHAAVLHLDGIKRRPFREKLSGVFECTKAADHAIVAGTPSSWQVPHSRFNEVPEDALASSGYCILSRLHGAGADVFVKQKRSLFLFVQGHLEYDSRALFREYRRDIKRFLSGERDSYPEMPYGYFNEDAAAALIAFRRMALESRSVDLLFQFPALMAQRTLSHTWREPAVRIYSNWLSCVSEHKSQRYSSMESPVLARVAPCENTGDRRSS